jgi:hypothetical protein
MAETLESSQYTSVQRRIQALEQAASSPASQGKSVDSFLSPLTIDEQNDSIGACANQTRQRCSDKGFLSMSIVDYLELLDASARLVRPDKTGYTPGDVAPIFQRLNLDPDNWKMQIKDFGRIISRNTIRSIATKATPILLGIGCLVAAEVCNHHQEDQIPARYDRQIDLSNGLHHFRFLRLWEIT